VEPEVGGGPADGAGEVALMPVRVLASGVDRLELSVRGSVRHEVLRALEVAKLEAQRMREAEPYRFAEGGRGFLVQASGRRAYPYVLRSPDYGLTVRPNGELPPVRAEILSAYLHEVGAAAAVADVEGLLAEAVFVVAPDVLVSRVDVYADVQGWELGLMDAGRFVSRARRRTAYTMGHRFTGFVFGEGGPLLARVYDKTAEIARQGEGWLSERWGEREDERPVWRLEFQVRRRVLAEFGARSPAEVLDRLQNLWRHGTGEWLTLREQQRGQEAWRWPVDASWTVVQGVWIGAGVPGVRRQRRTETHRDRVVRFLQGGLTTLGALSGVDEIGVVLVLARREVVRYLAEQGRTFGDEVRHKRARLELVAELERAPGGSERPGAAAAGQTPCIQPGEGGGAHQRGREEEGGRVADGRECAGAPVGAAPPTLPEGSEPNLSTRRRRAVTRGADRRRWRVRDGGVGGGTARQRSRRTGHVGDRERLRPGRGRASGIRLSASSSLDGGRAEP
jgi:hypothetical protein